MNFFDTPWLQELWARIAPTGDSGDIPAETLIIVLVVAGIAVGVHFVWVRFRLLITLVHELGHAVIGMLVGRKFTGFVLRGDMSGAAVTAGPVKGFGRIITTWAGYPAPAVIGALFAWLGAEGWAAPVITVVLLILIIALFRVRSFLTAVVMLVSIAAFGALWWWREDAIQAPVLLGLGTVLVIGAWRHLGAVFLGGGPESDPGVLAQLTSVPKFIWNLSFALVCALATGVVAAEFSRVIWF
ncbi:MAG: M50 family metallopeptidase [Gulosibacter sp.]|uniref:M50 family metallopeptidase n=1 Tax=Gulosibacter sp. TaxID=2817531 RepID=UPI003F8DE505